MYTFLKDIYLYLVEKILSPWKDKEEEVKLPHFLIKYNLSDEMLSFTSFKKEEKKCKLEIYCFLSKYVKTKKLIRKENFIYILPDESLTNLLNYQPEKDGILTFMKMHSLINNHFISE